MFTGLLLHWWLIAAGMGLGVGASIIVWMWPRESLGQRVPIQTRVSRNKAYV